MTPLEKMIDRVGGEGRYQIVSFLLFSSLWFFTAWILVGQAFFMDNSYTCKGEPDIDKCHEMICKLEAHDRSNYIDEHANSIVFAFEGKWMICENDYLRPILTSMTYIGSLIGFFIFPFMADNTGRRPAILVSWGVYGLGVLCLCISDSPNMVAMGYLFAGMGCNPAITISYSFLNEQCLGAKRQYFSVGIQLFLAVGECVIGLLFIPKLSWRYIFYLLFGCILVTLLGLTYLIESPKFLISKSKKQALEALNQIAKINKKRPIKLEEINELEILEEPGKGASVLDLFKYRSLRWISIGSGIVFMAIQVIYYGTSLNLDKAGYNMLTNQEIIGISEAVSYIAAEFIINKIRRKKSSLIGMGLSVIFCFSLGLLTLFDTDPENHDIFLMVETVGLIINRFILCGFWVIFYVFISELYPTRVRSMGMGWVSAVGTVGSALASYMIFFSEKLGINSWFPPAVVGLLGVFSIFCLKETFGKPMKDEIQEVEESSISRSLVIDDLLVPIRMPN